MDSEENPNTFSVSGFQFFSDFDSGNLARVEADESSVNPQASLVVTYDPGWFFIEIMCGLSFCFIYKGMTVIRKRIKKRHIM